MKKCIICSEEINNPLIVNFDEIHSAHLECWTEKIPNTSGMYASEEEKKKRSEKIQEIANEIVEEFKSKCK